MQTSPAGAPPDPSGPRTPRRFSVEAGLGVGALNGALNAEEKARDLRRMKMLATGLLLAATVIFLLARWGEAVGAPGWVGFVRATAEAAMVGALADWFAVTALFRHPLGLPIPHTAIIPNRKNEIGRSLGEFVQGNFLTREVINERLASFHVGERFGRWLADPSNAERAAAATADAMGGVLEVLDDRSVQDALGSAVERRLEATEVAPLLGKAIDVAVAGGHHQRMLNGVMKGIGGFLEDNRTMLRDRLDQESPWWVPESLDDRVFEKIFGAVQRFLADVSSSPQHEVRSSIDERIRVLAVKLRDDPVLIEKCESMKRELLRHPDVQAWLQSLWGGLKASMVTASRDPDSELRTRMVSGFANVGVRLTTNTQMQAKVDDWVERLVAHIVENYKHEVAGVISSTVERWDSLDTSRRIELQVGRDLQFIRINGTVVGGLAGVVIHALSELFF